MTSSSNVPIKVGVLFSSSGVTAPIELSQQRATILAAEEINLAGGINGRELQLVFRDPASTPARYAALIQQLIVEEQIRVVVGCYMSSTRKAVIPIVELARWAGASVGATEGSTPERLAAAEQGGVLSAADARTLTDAFGLALELRIEHQTEQLAAGAAPDDWLDPRALSPLTRDHLRDVFRAVAGVQRTLRE